MKKHTLTIEVETEDGLDEEVVARIVGVALEHKGTEWPTKILKSVATEWKVCNTARTAMLEHGGGIRT